MKLVIVIPTFNNYDKLHDLIIFLSTIDKFDLEIVIVDSSDNPQKKCTALIGDLSIHYIYVKSDKWWTGSILAGLEFTSTLNIHFDGLLLLNDDILLNYDIFNCLFSELNKNLECVYTSPQINFNGSSFFGFFLSPSLKRIPYTPSNFNVSSFEIGFSNGSFLFIPYSAINTIKRIKPERVPHLFGDIVIYLTLINHSYHVHCLNSKPLIHISPPSSARSFPLYKVFTHNLSPFHFFSHVEILKIFYSKMRLIGCFKYLSLLGYEFILFLLIRLKNALHV